MAANFEIEDRFVSFIDVIGFKSLVTKAEGERNPSSIIEIMANLACDDYVQVFSEHGPPICPESEKLAQDIGFQSLQVSDCLIISAERSICGLINVINHCRMVSETLLMRNGVFLRGAIDLGPMYHRASVFFGSAYQRAVEAEKRAGAVFGASGDVGLPLIELSPNVVSFHQSNSDDCSERFFREWIDQIGSSWCINTIKATKRYARYIADSPLSKTERFEQLADLKSQFISIAQIIDVDTKISSIMEKKNYIDNEVRTYLSYIDDMKKFVSVY